LALAGLLPLLGIGLAALVSTQALLVAAAIFVSIILYNLLKPTPAGPVLMGLCRAFNLLLGMYGLNTLLPLPAVRPMGAMFLYVTFLTVFARREAGGTSRGRLVLGTAGMAAAVVSLWGLRWHGDNSHYHEYRFLAAALLGGVLYLGLTSILQPTAMRVQRAVKFFIMGIVLLDAAVAWNASGPAGAIAVLSLLSPCVLLARVLRVT